MPLRLLTAGESHGPQLTAILEGMVAGLDIDEEFVRQELQRRQRGVGAGPRMKIERDEAHFVGGVLEGRTTGAPLAIVIPNLDHARWKGRAHAPMLAPRPGHADLTGALKYDYADLRPALERASARETAARVAAGAVCKLLLREFGLLVFGYVVAIGEVEADLSAISLEERMRRAEHHETRCPHPRAAAAMAERIASAMQQKDTLGGIIEVVATGVPIGLGSHVQADRRLGARLAAAVMGTQAMKGVEIGEAFANTRRPGTQVQDAINVDSTGKLTRPTNHAGGLEGGITNGQPLVVRAAMKPIATTLTPQETVNLAIGQAGLTEYERSDFCPVPRAVPILEGVIALVLADALLEKLGGDTLPELKSRFAALPQGQLSDFHLDSQEHVYWP
jgi:chorismate synthase